MRITDNDKYLIINENNIQKTYRQISQNKIDHTYKPINITTINEETIQIIGYFYKDGTLKIIDWLNNHIDLPREVEYPAFNRSITALIEQEALYCAANASVEGDYMGGY